ncbi:hypothetical protein VTN00DRAFT_6583 [Thermoascus crustaceus]|uniref:uncharacterized protein n=1 Tax=Thermoascus crustaceus TaxID=5088 RepID=UPI0037432EE8
MRCGVGNFQANGPDDNSGHLPHGVRKRGQARWDSYEFIDTCIILSLAKGQLEGRHSSRVPASLNFSGSETASPPRAGSPGSFSWLLLA